MTVEGDIVKSEADLVGESLFALPAAPMVMPRQVLERQHTLVARLAGLFGGARVGKAGN
ncbi:hypothetical protein V8J36_00055 [Frigidibacter sp. MR17.14]|uniref:hypothetical protein n=1 Tax=Frigidibacter sp. MR17.14 TaxID=3126509 RepID=UPI003012E3B6